MAVPWQPGVAGPMGKAALPEGRLVLTPQIGTWITVAAGAPGTARPTVEPPGPHALMEPPPQQGTTVAIKAPVPARDSPPRPIEVPATEAVKPTSPREGPLPETVVTADLPAAVGVQATSKVREAVREVPGPRAGPQVHPVPVEVEIDLSRSNYKLNS